MGKERISSQEIADYTNINATQIRRDLSDVREVRQARRRLQHRRPARRDPQDPADAGPAQHRARRRRPARRGDRELADLRRARDQHRGRLRQGSGQGRPSRRQRRGQRVPRARRRRPRQEHHRRRARRSRRQRPVGGGRPVDAGVRIIFNYSEALLDMPLGRRGAHVEPRGRSALRALLPPHVAPRGRSGFAGWPPITFSAHGRRAGLTPDEQIRSAREAVRAATDFTVAVEEEFAILDPETLVARRTGSRSCRPPPRRPSSRSTSSAS